MFKAKKKHKVVKRLSNLQKNKKKDLRKYLMINLVSKIKKNRKGKKQKIVVKESK